MASRTTARASSATKSWSRTPNTSSGSSGYDYDAAERARLEAERQKKIQENKDYIAKIQATNAEVKKARDKIAQAKALLTNALSGAKYNEYIKYLEGQDQWLSQIGNDLNSCGEKAAENIRGNGEAYTFNKSNTDPNLNNNKDTNKTLSVNTDELQKLADLLGDINTSAKSIDSKVSGILGNSSKVGVPNSYNLKDNSRNVINSVSTLQDKLVHQIQETEKTEKENLNIIDGLFNWLGSLFKPLNKKETSQPPTTRTTTRTTATTRTTTPGTTTPRTTTPPTTRTTTLTRTRTTTPTRTRTINGNSLDSVAMDELLELAKIYGIPTSGKSQREILEALALKLGIPLSEESSGKNSRLWRNTMD